MKKIITILFLFSSTIYCANEFIVQDIYFEGLQNIHEKNILSKIPIKKRERINKEKIKKTINYLFSTKKFKHIKILKEKKNIIIKVKEYPIIKKIILLKNKNLNNKFIKKKLKKIKIENGKFLNEQKLEKFKKNMEKYYYKIGKFNINITSKIIQLPLNNIKLKLIFNEGKTAKIKQINIIGNKNFSYNKLIEKFKFNKQFILFNLFSNQEYKKEKILQGIKNIEDFYDENGYIQFNINSINIELTPDKNKIYLTINITEGNKYSIQEIKINEIEKKYFYEIKKIIKIKKNTTYNRKLINKIEKKIRNILNKDGYSYPDILKEIKINKKDKTIKLKINIKTGKRFYVRKINFLGNKKTKDYILRSEIEQMEGTWLNTNLIKKSTKKLGKTGFFEKINIKIKPVKNTQNQVDIIYKIKERNTGSINFGMGLGIHSGLSFKISLQEDNLFGTGKSIKIISNKNNFSNYTELSITDPYFTTNNLKLSQQIFYDNFNAKKAELSKYQNKTYGINGNITIPINRNNKFDIGLSFINNFLSNIQPQISIWRYLTNIDKNVEFNNPIEFKNNDYTMNLSWIFDNLDSKIFPKKGNKTIINNKITIPGLKNKYYKINFHRSEYYPILKNKKLILSYQIKLGYGNGINNGELPFYKNFYLGGPETIRGFHTNNIGPKAIYLEKNINNNEIQPKKNNPSQDTIGGNFMTFASLELTIPDIFKNKKYENFIRTSFFVDMGNVWDSNWEKTKTEWIKNMPNYGNPLNIRVSTGIVFRCISPIGPLVFSYAKPLKMYSDDKIEEFQFSIGKTW